MNFFHPKLVTFVLALAAYLWEWKKGWFREFGVRSRKTKIGFYLQILAFFILVAVGLFFLDSTLLHFVQDFNRPFFKAISRLGGFLGREINPWLFLIAWYFLGFVLHRLTWMAVSFGAIFSGMLASIFCHISKLLFLRARPNSNQGPFSFFNFEALSGGGGRFYSFPSGDVVVVAATAYFVMLQTKNVFLRIILFLLPMTTAIARMDANKHWPSDTVLSLGLGLVCALFVQAFTSLQTEKAKA